ncbi:hypothetical protein BLNAU_12391 [Blattamonas nauphoetae]|uniref:Uncharacterized protein n=1 Tax=Blattamonas nauphoetae TaxID=2049346 RepID=A0ABQ9XMW3_9EUKA|nr:hypothetical protein BLNAU_12391 [Blattamonas nauphoetae]
MRRRGRGKAEGVIGLDIGKEKQRMEELLKTKMREMEQKDHLRETERQREREEMKRKEAKRQEEFDKRMEEVNRIKPSVEAVRAKNQQMMEQERRLAEQERKRQEEEEQQKRYQIGAAAIELFDQDEWTVSGNVFSRLQDLWASLVSFEFGAVVARLSLTIRKGPTNDFAVGIISFSLSKKVLREFFPLMKGGAGWGLFLSARCALQNQKMIMKGSACLEGRKGQRVVLEADGREGKRTLKLSQDGETQPVIFTNIPVPFRFAVCITEKDDGVEIESVEAVDEPLIVGGMISVQMDE